MPPPAHVLLCYDASDAARRAIERAGALVGGGRATVLTVCEPTATIPAFDPGSVVSDLVGRLTGLTKEMDGIGRELAGKAAAEGAELAGVAGFDAQPRVVTGQPWPSILQVADELDADLVVAGTRGASSGVSSALMGSVATGLVHHSKRPVLVIPAA